MSCNLTCSWGGAQGCDQADADIFCKLRTGNSNSKATKFALALPTDLGGFPCSDPKVFFPEDLRVNLGPLPEFGVAKDVRFQARIEVDARFDGQGHRPRAWPARPERAISPSAGLHWPPAGPSRAPGASVRLR